MVTIRYIQTTKCPICDCDVVISEHVETEIGTAKIRQHTNGGVWEHREFACGCRIDYIPNFSKEYVGKQCPQDPVLLAEKQRNLAALSSVMDYIVDLDCSEEYKTKLSNAISHLGG